MKRIISAYILVLSMFLLTLSGEDIVPKPFNPGEQLNTKFNDFSPSITADGKIMVFNSNRDGAKYQNLYITRFVKGAWSKPVSIQGINSKFSDETPFITSDGKILFFASDRDGSAELRAGGKVRVSYDLYWSWNSPKGWTKPVRIPGEVNTMMHERSPFLSKDRKRLFFTSWPFGQSSKAMVMVSEFKNGRFGKAMAMPPPFNMGNRDMALIETDKGFYFSSNRKEGFGGWDIYFVSFKNKRFGEVTNLGPLINSKAHEVYYYKSSNVAYFCSNRSDGLGKFDIFMAGFNIHAIYFDFDSSILKKESFHILDRIVKFFKMNNNIKFSITGHTDLNGSEKYNLKLSLARAESVKKYLVSKGLKGKRFIVHGAGKSEPIINKKGPEYNKKNRRTEFRIMGLVK